MEKVLSSHVICNHHLTTSWLNRVDKEVRAFDAREVLTQVGPRVVRPEQVQR